MLQAVRARLQYKLVLAFILVMLIPIVTSAVYMLARSREILIAQAQSDQLRLASARAADAEDRIDAAVADLLLLIKAPTLRRYSQDATRIESDQLADTQQLFQAFLQQSAGTYTSLCLLTEVGQEVTCVRLRDGQMTITPADQLRDRAGEPSVTNAIGLAGMPGRQPVAITMVADLPAGAPALAPPQVIAYSALFQEADGRPAGILVLEAAVERLIAPLIDPTEGIQTTVVDSAGRYLAHPSQPTLNGTLRQDHPADAAIILGQPAGTLLDTADRPGTFQVFARIRPRGQGTIQWTVIYEQPLRNVLQEVYETQLVILVIAGIGLIVAIVVAHLLTRSIVRPVTALAAAARRVGSGDLQTPFEVRSNDEIGALARTFQATVDQLRETLDTAEQRRREAETLNAAALTLTSTLDLRRVLDRILYELRRVVPYESASVQLNQGDYTQVLGAYGLNMPEIVGHQFSLQPGLSPNAEVVGRPTRPRPRRLTRSSRGSAPTPRWWPGAPR